MSKYKTTLLLACALGLTVAQAAVAAQNKPNGKQNDKPSSKHTAQKPATKTSAQASNKPAQKVASKTTDAKGKAVTAQAKSSASHAKVNNTDRKPAKLNVALRQQLKNSQQANTNLRQVVATRSLNSAPAPMDATGPLALGSSAALVLDSRTGESIYQKNASLVMPIASISKLMSAMVVLDAGLNLSEVVTIGPEDVDLLKNSHSRLPVGASMTRETALLLALMSSDNRATHTLARHYPGGVAAFVNEMNRKAQAIGMTDTRFEEPTGLNSNNVSTARDLARMVSAASRYPRIRELSTTAEARIQVGKRELAFHNSNALVGNPEWEIGLSKTGYISEAGRCLVMHTKVGERPVIMVLLDSVGKMTRVGDAVRIKRWMEQASLGRDSLGRDIRGA